MSLPLLSFLISPCFLSSDAILLVFETYVLSFFAISEIVMVPFAIARISIADFLFNKEVTFFILSFSEMVRYSFASEA